MLVLAPDPRLGIAPDRVTRVRTLLGEVTSRGASVPGVVVALPGGPDGVLDAVVVRPDGVIGLAPLAVEARESVGAGGGRPAPEAAGSSGSPVASLAPAGITPADVETELDRLLGLPDPPCSAPRRVAGTRSAGEHHDDPDATGGALAAPIGSFRVLDVDDLRRLLAAFRLAEHLPSADELAAAGFLDAGTPATHAGATPPTPSPVPPASTVAVPATAPVPVAAPSTRSSPRVSRMSRTGRGPRQRPSAVARWGASLPAWVRGWYGLGLAAVAAFGVALGLAVLVGRATLAPSDPLADPTATRVVDGVTFSRQVATSDVSCEGRAYGLAADFLQERGCLHLDRSLWAGTADGRQVVVAVATVQMPDTSTAGALRSLIDTDGTGNVSDLLREGRTFPGAPDSLSGAGYASAQLGDRVVIAEADGFDPSFTDGEQLDRLSRAGLALR